MKCQSVRRLVVSPAQGFMMEGPYIVQAYIVITQLIQPKAQIQQMLESPKRKEPR